MIKGYFGYITPQELDCKMKTAHIERDAYLHYSVENLDFAPAIVAAKEAKEKLLQKLSKEVQAKFDEKGRAFIKVDGLEDEDYRSKAVSSFRSNLNYKERSYLFEFTEAEFIEGKTSKDKLVVINETETLSISAGTRMGRVLRKIFKKAGFPDAEVERIVQTYSLVNNEKVSGYLVLSVNPFDFLSMSWGQNWGSCMDAGGEYETGTLSWALDENSFIGYLISESEYDTINNDEGYQKRWRKMFTLSDNADMLLANRGYPYDGAGLSQELILSIFPFHYSYHSTEYAGLYNRIITASSGQLYNDVGRGNKIMLFTNVEYEDLQTADNRVRFPFGKRITCLCCGGKRTAATETFMGDCCHSSSYCECCDESVSEDEAYYLDSEGITVCEYCLSEYYRYSEIEMEYIYYDCAVWVESEETYAHEDNPNLRYCENCDNYYMKEKDSDQYCESCKEAIEQEKAAKLKEEDVIQ